MLSADMLKEQNNIIGYHLANELQSNKNVTWGLKVKYYHLNCQQIA